jgi:hypothetical protein
MRLRTAPAAALVLGAVAALGALAIPTPTLESLVMGSGLPAVLGAAEPPLGFTARAAVAVAAGGLATLLAWLALAVLLGARDARARGLEEMAPEAVPTPVLRRADAHPDAPPRPPLLATRDLGTPFLDIRAPAQPEKPIPQMEPEVKVPEAPAPAEACIAAPPAALAEQPLPKDLDQPLAAFDPQAIPEVPMPSPVKPPLRSRAPRPAVFDTRERFEVYPLTPPPRRASPLRAAVPPRSDDAIARPETEASVHALLDRLERGVVRKGLAAKPAARPRDAERGLEEALVTLRALARHA